MKNIFNIMRNVANYLYPATLILMVMFLGTMSVSAFENRIMRSSIVVWYYGDNDTKLILNGVDGQGCNSQDGYDFSGYKFGVVENLRLKQFVGAGQWDNNNWLSDNSFSGYYRIYRQGSNPPGWTVIGMINNQQCEHNDNHLRTYNSSNDIDLIYGLTPGNYYFEVAMSMWNYWNGGSYNRMIPGQGQYSSAVSGYNSTFTIAGFRNYPGTKTSPETKNGKTVSFDISFEHYGTALKKSDIGAKVVLSGAGSSNFQVTNLTNSKVTVKFTAPASGTSDVNAKLTVKDADEKKMEVNLVGKVIEGTIPTAMIAETPVSNLGPKVSLYGFMKYSGCRIPINKYGFFYCKRDNANTPCTPTSSSLKVEKSEVIYSGEIKFAGKPFDITFTEGVNSGGTTVKLVANSVYDYKAFVYSDDNDDRGYYLSSETGTFETKDICPAPTSDIIYTLDNTQEADRCELRFKTLEAIVADMKTSDWHSQWLDNDGKLLTDITIQVVKSEYQQLNNVGTQVRHNSLENINKVTSITSDPSPLKPSYRLTVKAKESGKKNMPTFLGGISLLGSRYITLENLIITRSSDLSSHDGSALELGYYQDNSDNPNKCLPGQIKNTDIRIINCDITATGFNCVHACGCQYLTFEGCNFTMTKAGTTDNDKHWGASFKLMGCYGVKFIRNSIKGSHATTVWLQHTQNTLIMNNVFWNTNEYADNVAFIRPMMFKFNGQDSEGSSAEEIASREQHKITNVGIYYNTFYLADRCTSTTNGNSCTTSSSTDKIDFIRFGGPSNAYKSANDYTNNQHQYKLGYDVEKIHFMYNNCYSYDVNILSSIDKDRSFLNYTDADLASTFAHNNFWGKPDKSTPNSTKFYFGSDMKHVDVEAAICKSSATNPDGLVVKGSTLNIGSKLATDISQLGVANATLADRFNDDCRPAYSDTWTYGAYQQSSNQVLDVIYWTGDKSGKWDTRGNWRTADDKPVTCAHSFSTNLRVVIPDAGEVNNIPEIPAWGNHVEGDTDDPRGLYPEEFVEAGRSAIDSDPTTQYAAVIDMQEGAAIIGIENLYNGGNPMRYASASNHFEVERNIWMPVGTVIRPWDEKKQEFRDMQSGEFYIENHEPHVYMQQFVNDDKGVINPGIPFTDMDTPVEAGKSFGIYIPDQYGPYKLPSQLYYSDGVDRSSDAIPYTFSGRFANDDGIPSYTVPANGEYLYANNSYTANLNLTTLLGRTSNLQALYFDLVGQGYNAPSLNVEKPTLVKPQNGFVLYWDGTHAAETITMQASDYDKSSTKYERASTKRASADTNMTLKVQNVSDVTYSLLRLAYGVKNQSKAFSVNEKTPEVYVIGDGNAKYGMYGVNDVTTAIPLGVRNKQSYNMAIKFILDDNMGFESVVLEDRQAGKTYDLTAGEEPSFSKIVPGDCEGRFYLYVDYVDGDYSTDAPETREDISADGRIEIYSIDNMLVISSPSDIVIEQIFVTDLSGRTYEIQPSSPNYSENILNVAQGVYTVCVIANKGTKVQKVVIK